MKHLILAAALLIPALCTSAQELKTYNTSNYNGQAQTSQQECCLGEEECQPDKEEKPYVHVEQMPEFRGGQQALLDYISNKLKYPEIAKKNSIEGMVVIQFVVKADGTVGDVKVTRSLDPDCDKEAVRLVRSLPRWTPGRQNGRAVPVYYTLPIRFRIR